MIATPAAVKTLVKSRVMFGSDKPTHRIVLKESASGALTDPTVWTTWRYIAGDATDVNRRGYGNMVETQDGRAAISYVENDKVYIAYASSVSEVLAGTTTFNFAGATLIKSANEYKAIQTSLTLIQNKLHLAITNWTWISPYRDKDWILECEHWVDTDGNGAGMAFKNYISTDLSKGTSWARGLPTVGPPMGQIICLSDTNWVIMCPWWNYVYVGSRACYTIDAGETWQNGAHTPASLFYYLAGSGVSVLPMDDTSFLVSWQSTSSREKLLVYTGYGAYMSNLGDWGTGWPGGGDDLRGVGFIAVGGKTYMARLGLMRSPYDIYVLNDGVEITYDNVVQYANWTLIKTLSCFDEAGVEPKLTMTNNALILQHCNGDSISAAGTLSLSKEFSAKKITVTKNRDQASSAIIVFDNKNGIYSPEAESSQYYHTFLPNVEIEVYLGYGQNCPRVFTGYISKVDPSSFPHELVISVIGKYKKALEQKVIDPAVVDPVAAMSFNINGLTVTEAFLKLAGWAGLTVSYSEVSPIVIEEKEFKRINYSDVFDYLIELSGFEVIEQADGTIHWAYATDRQPETEETVVLNGTTAVELAEYPLVTASIRVYSGALKAGTLYAATDYTIVEGTVDTEWTIARTAGSTIPDGATVYIDYVYAAWVFKEAVDMMPSFAYSYDDQDIFSKVYVIGKDESENEIYGSADVVGHEIYNLPPGKIGVIELNEKATVEALNAIAAEVAKDIVKKLRSVRFGASGVPYIEPGDCIGAIETSSGISEIYRAMALSLSFDVSPKPTFVMTIDDCYHYGYSPLI